AGPLYLHAAPGERATAVFPLFWYFQRGGSLTHLLAPLYLRAERELSTTTVVLNAYFRKGRGADEGSWSFHFFPLLHVGRPHPGDVEWDVLFGLIGYSRIGERRKLKLAWFWDANLASAAPIATTRRALALSDRPDLFF